MSDTPKVLEALKGAGIETRGDFFNLDKDMRQELDGELKNGGVNLGDRAKIKKAEDTGVTIKQGNGEVTVLNLKPGQAMQTVGSLVRVFLGLGWSDKGKPVDVDASCIGFNTGNPQEKIFFGNLGNATKSLKHSGDVLNGNKNPKGKDIPDMERIYVWLPNIPANIDCLVFVAQVYTSGADFASLSSAYIRMVNADTNQELGRLTLAGTGLKGNGIVFAKVYRCGGPKAPWHFHCLGMPLNVPGASTVDAIVPHLQESGCAFSPPGAQVASPGAPGAGGGAAPAAKPASGGAVPPAKDDKKKSQTPTGVYVAGALAVATVGGIAAATAIFMNPDIGPEGFSPALFENGVDFGSLVPNEDTITGIGEGIADGAGAAYEWAEGVTESVDFGAIGDTMGDAAGTVGEGLGSAAEYVGDGMGEVMNSDAMVAVGDGLGDAGEAVGGAAGDAFGAMGDAAPGAMDAMGGAAGDVGDFAGEAGGAMAEGAGAAVGAVGDAAPGMFEGIGEAAGAIGEAVGGLLSMFGSD